VVPDFYARGEIYDATADFLTVFVEDSPGCTARVSSDQNSLSHVLVFILKAASLARCSIARKAEWSKIVSRQNSNLFIFVSQFVGLGYFVINRSTVSINPLMSKGFSAIQ